jgi:hypothetical protein
MWFAPAKRWREQTVAIAKIDAITLVLLALVILLTFPPLADLIQGK